MNEILKTVLSLSLSGSLLILILLLGRPLIRNRISRRWQYYIWLAVIARLLLPFAPHAGPIGALFQKTDRAVIQAYSAPVPGQEPSPNRFAADRTSIENSISQPDGTPRDATSAPQRVLTILTRNLWLIWLMGALILLIRKITIYQSFVKYIKAARAEVSDTALLDRLAVISEQIGIKRPVELYKNDLISSPLLLGFFHPCILLPTAGLSDTDFHYTVLHELTHYKKRDMFYKWLIQITVCLHWFNPLAHGMGRETVRACELACDEWVIRELDRDGQRDYGDTLIHAIGTGGRYNDSLACVTLNESKALLKERLEAIMKFKGTSRSGSAISILLTILILCTSLYTGAYAADFKSPADNHLQNIIAETVLLDMEQELTTIDVRAAVGNVTFKYGDKPQLEIGAGIIGHASFSYDNGTLVYRDDFEGQRLSFDDTDSDEYKITITIPQNLILKNLFINVKLGSIDLQNIMTCNAEITGTSDINLDGFHSTAVRIHGTLAEIRAAGLSIMKEFSLYSYGSTAVISGTIQGNIYIDSAGISDTDITLYETERDDYSIKSTWKPESGNKDPGNFLLQTETGSMLIDGQKYNLEYTDPESEAPYAITIISRELMPMENISINFAR